MKEKEKVLEPWELYRSLQLTPEQKAEARARLEAQTEEAARNGVYERFLELLGTVDLRVTKEVIEELREDRD